MSLSDLILLIIVIAFFAKKIYEKKKGKNVKNINNDIERSKTLHSVDVWKYVADYDNGFDPSDLGVFVYNKLQRYYEQGIEPDVEYKFNCNVFYVIVMY